MIKSVRFADSQATIASLVEGLQNMTARMNDNAESFGMKINIKRTQVMGISKSPGEEFTIMLGGKELAEVKQFTYRGSILLLRQVTVEETSVRELQVQRMPSLQGKSC